MNVFYVNLIIIHLILKFSWSKPAANVVTFPAIDGDKYFVEKVTNSLQLLKTKAPVALGFINRYLKKIQTYPKSGMCVWCDPPTFQLKAKEENLELYWLASTIGHESYHSYLYQSNKALLNGNEPPYDKYAGFESERKCNAYQLNVLRAIGAPSSIIKYMESQDGRHCDLNSDGVCDDKDYQLREYSIKGKWST